MIKYKDQTYKVVVVTPAGREEYMSVFKAFIYRKIEEGFIDHWQLWVNTVKESDIAYLARMEAENPKVKRYFLSSALVPTYQNCDPMRSYEFFRAHCQDDDTIYIRFDDDIVWIEEGALEKIVQARIDHPEAFVIYPNIVNSTVCSAWHQDNGAVGKDAGDLRLKANYPVGHPDHIYLNEFAYTDSGFITYLHSTFIKRYNEGTLSAFYLPSRSMTDFQHFSICCVCFWGKDHLQVGPLEEGWIAWEEPQRLNRPVYFLGDALLVHYSYHTQRDYMRASAPQYLDFYRSVTH